MDVKLLFFYLTFYIVINQFNQFIQEINRATVKVVVDEDMLTQFRQFRS
jgi:hypothetical protein